MAKAWNFITKNQYENCSYNDTVGHPPSAWIINPDFDAVGGKYDPDPMIHRYWKQDGGDPQAVVEMTPTEKSVVDAAELPNDKINVKNQLIIDFADYIKSRYDDSVRMFFVEVYDNMGGTAKGLIDDYNTWVETVGDYYTIIANSIDSAANKTALDAISWDFTSFDGTDPLLTIQTLLNS